jgi:glycerol-3-phosphate acyltransferase PlsX
MPDAPARELRIALDAMGGDHAPRAAVEAAAELSLTSPIRVVLVGDPRRIDAELARVPHRRDRLDVLRATQAVGMAEKPRQALDDKPDASILVASRALADGAADGLVSAGSTGAVVLATARHVPLIEGVRRAALAAVYPTQQRRANRDRFALLLDVGATVRCTAEQLLFFAYMGHAYASRISKVDRPTIGLLNMGEEETKGDEVLVAAHQLMKADPRLDFVGNIEGNQLPLGVADVIVCEGLLGNVVLKMAEGVFEAARSIGEHAFKTKLRWKLGIGLLSSGLRQIKALTDYGEYGGAPLLGLQKIVIKAHGRSGPRTLVNAVKVAAKAVRGGVAEEIARSVGEFSARRAER